jgi:hypothetical protein
MVIDPDDAKHPLPAFYSDNEGNITAYAVTASADGKGVVFRGDTLTGSPRFRPTDTLTGQGPIAVAFEMAPPSKPDSFQKFIEGKTA